MLEIEVTANGVEYTLSQASSIEDVAAMKAAAEDGQFSVDTANVRESYVSAWLAAEYNEPDEIIEALRRFDDEVREDIQVFSALLGLDWEQGYAEFEGVFSDKAEFAQSMVDSLGIEIPNWVAVNWESTADDLLLQDYRSEWTPDGRLVVVRPF